MMTMMIMDEMVNTKNKEPKIKSSFVIKRKMYVFFGISGGHITGSAEFFLVCHANTLEFPAAMSPSSDGMVVSYLRPTDTNLSCLWRMISGKIERKVWALPSDADWREQIRQNEGNSNEFNNILYHDDPPFKFLRSQQPEKCKLQWYYHSCLGPFNKLGIIDLNNHQLFTHQTPTIVRS